MDAERFDHHTLVRLEEADEIEMRTPRGDGSTSSRPIWVVVVDGAPYVRSYQGERGAWYRRARADGRANIGVEGDNVAVRVVPDTGGELPARWVIHAATMELGGPTSADIIRRATASTLAKADELGARSLALVAFGTGVGGFSLDEAARIEAEEVRRHLDGGSGLERVVFAVRGAEAREAFERALR